MGLGRRREPAPVKISGLLVFLALLLMSTMQATQCLNVSQAEEALAASEKNSFVQKHSHEPSASTAASEIDTSHEEDDESSESFEDEEDEGLDDLSKMTEDKLSLLEDGDNEDWEDEDFDFDAMDEDDAQEVAAEMDGDERKNFLQMWEEHKAAREKRGNFDKEGTFMEL